MVKSPVEYFEAQSFNADPQGETAISSSERLFMQKYLGVDGSDASSGKVLESIAQASGDPHAEIRALDETASLEQDLRHEPQVQLVGFYMGNQLFTVPTIMVQEVIRTLEISRLPVPSRFVAGIINLRGHVTPMIRLRTLLECPMPTNNEADRFTVICRCRGLQLGIEIDTVRSMYRVNQEDIQWNVEVELGINSDCVAALFKLEEKLVPIISVERIVETMLHE